MAQQPASTPELTATDVLQQIDRRLTCIEGDQRRQDAKMEAGFASQDAKFQWTFGIILTSWLSTMATFLLNLRSPPPALHLTTALHHLFESSNVFGPGATAAADDMGSGVEEIRNPLGHLLRSLRVHREPRLEVERGQACIGVGHQLF